MDNSGNSLGFSNYYRVVFDSIYEMVWIVDLDYSIKACNKALKSHIGKREKDSVRDSPTITLPRQSCIIGKKSHPGATVNSVPSVSQTAFVIKAKRGKCRRSAVTVSL